MSINITCPRCNNEFDLLHARDDDDWRLLMEAILTLPPVTHRSMWAYLSLFKGKSKLRSSKMLRVVKQLAPMIKAAQLERNHIEYTVSPDSFARAMEYLVDNPPATLALPLKSNGYLLSILVNNAETAMQKAEQKTEKDKRTPYRDLSSAEDLQDGDSTNKNAGSNVSTSMPVDFKKIAGNLNPTLKQKHNTKGE